MAELKGKLQKVSDDLSKRENQHGRRLGEKEMVEMLLGKAHSIEFVSSQYYEEFVFLKEEAEEANLGAQLKSK